MVGHHRGEDHVAGALVCTRRASRGGGPGWRRVGGLSVVPSLLILFVLARGGLSRGNDEPPPQKGEASAADAQRALEKRLQGLRAQATRIAEALLPAVEKVSRIRVEQGEHQLAAASASASVKKAELHLESARLALTEFQKNARVELQGLDEEVEVRKANILTFTQNLETAKQAQKDLDQANPASRAELACAFLIARARQADEVELRREKASLELAIGKRRLQAEFEQPRRLVDLEAEVARAEADLRANRATLDLETMKRDSAGRRAAQAQLTPLETRLQRALEAAFAADDQAADRLAKNAPTREIEPLADKFAARVGEAQAIAEELQAERESARYQEVRQRLRTPPAFPGGAAGQPKLR